MSKATRFCGNFVILVFSLLIYLAWQIEATKSKIDMMIEASNNQRVASLSCHVCHSEMNESCFNFTEQGEDFRGFPQECDNSTFKMCVVKKFAFTSTDGHGSTTPMKTFSVKRNCATKCVDGCVVMGERTRLYVCSQCCSKPNCNVGSGSGSVHLVIDNVGSGFHHFLTSVANVHFFVGSFYNMWHLQIICLLSLQLFI